MNEVIPPVVTPEKVTLPFPAGFVVVTLLPGGVNGVDCGVGLAVGVAVGVLVGVAVGVPDGLAVGVAVGVGVPVPGGTSTAGANSDVLPRLSVTLTVISSSASSPIDAGVPRFFTRVPGVPLL